MKQNMPLPLWSFGATVVDSTIFVVGGSSLLLHNFSRVNGFTEASTITFDPTASNATWTTAAKIPVPRLTRRSAAPCSVTALRFLRER